MIFPDLQGVRGFNISSFHQGLEKPVEMRKGHVGNIWDIDGK
jgi:hypothetical protein